MSKSIRVHLAYSTGRDLSSEHYWYLAIVILLTKLVKIFNHNIGMFGNI